MAQIIVRFTNSSDFVGRAIDFVTSSLIDHIELGTKEGTWIGVRSDGGVQERPDGYSKVTTDWRYPLECTDAQYNAIVVSARADIGTKYDYSEIIGLLFHSRCMYSPHKLICSRFAIAKLAEGGIHLLNVEPDFFYLVTPEMCHLSPLLRGLRQDFSPKKGK